VSYAEALAAVHCRIGSSESTAVVSFGEQAVHCRIGSSETAVAAWLHG